MRATLPPSLNVITWTAAHPVSQRSHAQQSWTLAVRPEGSTHAFLLYFSLISFWAVLSCHRSAHHHCSWSSPLFTLGLQHGALYCNRRPMVSQDGNSSVGHVTCYPWSCDSSYWSTSGNIKEWNSDDVPSWMWNVFSLWRHWRTNILFMSCALLPNMFGSNDTLKTGKALHIYILIQIHLQNSGLFWIRQTQVSYRGNHVRSNILSYPNTLVEFPTEVCVSASCLTMSKKTEWNRQNTEAAVCGDSSETTVCVSQPTWHNTLQQPLKHGRPSSLQQPPLSFSNDGFSRVTVTRMNFSLE